jgi:hypothetical protein
MAEPVKKKKNALKGKGGLIMLAAVGLLSVVFFFEQKAPPPRDPDANPPVSEYAHLRSEDVTRVELKRPSGGFTLVRQGKNWAFEAPGRYRANTDSVNSWLKGVLEDATVDRTIEGKPQDLSTYGLDKPTVELVLVGRGGDTRTLQLGKDFKAPGDSGSGVFYAREAKDGRLFMLSSVQLEALRDKKLDDLRDKRLVELGEPKDVQKVSLVRATGSVELERQGEKWKMIQPYPAPADRTSVESELIGQLKTSESETFADNAATDLAKYGLDHPQLTVTATDKQGAHTVLFAQKDGKIYSNRQGDAEVVVVSKSTFDNLNKQPADLRDRQLISLTRDKITFVELKNSRGTTKLQKVSGNEWMVTGADGKQKKAKKDQVDRVLDTLIAPASKHVEEAPKDLKKYGLEQPVITVTANEGTGTSQILTIGKKAKDSYYAKGTPDAIFEVQGYVFSDLNVISGAFEDTTKK